MLSGEEACVPNAPNQINFTDINRDFVSSHASVISDEDKRNTDLRSSSQMKGLDKAIFFRTGKRDAVA